MTAPSHTLVHGVFLNIHGLGTLLTGASGVGKSALALALIQRGHALIADDAPEFFQGENGSLIGKSPKALQNLLELRGVGIVNIANLYGPQSVMPSQKLSLILHLEKTAFLERNFEPPQLDLHAIQTVSVPRMQITFSELSGVEYSIETAVRYFLWLQTTPTNSIALQSFHSPVGITQ